MMNYTTPTSDLGIYNIALLSVAQSQPQTQNNNAENRGCSWRKQCQEMKCITNLCRVCAIIHRGSQFLDWGDLSPVFSLCGESSLWCVPFAYLSKTSAQKKTSIYLAHEWVLSNKNLLVLNDSAGFLVFCSVKWATIKWQLQCCPHCSG